MVRGILWLMACTMLGAGTSAVAKPTAEQPAALRSLLECRSVADSMARLACFDRQAAEIGAATERDDLVIMDKEAVRKTRRSLFGFSLPRLPFLGGDKDEGEGRSKRADDEPDSSRIEAKVQSVRAIAYGRWAFVLDDGARWETIEELGGRDPKAGGSVIIKRAALGSFMAQFDGGRWVRAKRVN